MNFDSDPMAVSVFCTDFELGQPFITLPMSVQAIPYRSDIVFVKKRKNRVPDKIRWLVSKYLLALRTDIGEIAGLVDLPDDVGCRLNDIPVPLQADTQD